MISYWNRQSWYWCQNQRLMKHVLWEIWFLIHVLCSVYYIKQHALLPKFYFCCKYVRNVHYCYVLWLGQFSVWLIASECPLTLPWHWFYKWSIDHHLAGNRNCTMACIKEKWVNKEKFRIWGLFLSIFFSFACLKFSGRVLCCLALGLI